MQRLMRRLRLLRWYLGRAGHRRELSRHFLRWLRSQGDPKREEATAWCRSRALNLSDAVSNLVELGSGEEMYPWNLESMYQREFEWAEQAKAACPVTMGAGASMELLYTLARSREARLIIETGVAYGYSSLAFLLAMKAAPTARLYSVDRPYPLLENDAFVGCVVPPWLQESWILLRFSDAEVLPSLVRRLSGQVDLVHYDSDKSIAGRRWAYPLLWGVLRSGGLFISDDISDNYVFKEFCAQLGAQSIVVEVAERYVGILVKP